MRLSILICSILLVIVSLNSLNGQIHLRKQFLSRGDFFYNNSQLDSAIINWERVLLYFQESAPEYGEAILKIANAYYKKSNLKMAINWYETLLLTDVNSKHPGFENMEHYANYKQKGCKKLAILNYQSGLYQTALRYAKLAQEQPFYSEDLEIIESEAVSIANWQAFIYKKLEQPDSAFLVLSTKLFDRPVILGKGSVSEANRVDYYQSLRIQALELLPEIMNPKLFVEILDKGLKRIKIKYINDVSNISFSVGKFRYKIVRKGKISKEGITAQIKATDFYHALAQHLPPIEDELEEK